MKRKVFVNYLYTIAYQILMVITPLITAPYISHILHADGVGVFSYTTTIASAFALFAALGVNVYGQRQIAYYQDDLTERSRVFWELFIIRLLTTLIVTAAYIVMALWYKEYTYYLLIQTWTVIATAIDISWFYQGIEEFKTISLRNMAVKIVTVILIFVVVKDASDLGKYIVLCAMSSFVGYGFFFVNLGKKIERFNFKELKFRRHVKFIFTFFVPIIATQIYSQLDKIMLGAMTIGDIENGYYEQARKIVNIVITLVTAINTVLLPRISNLHIKGEKQQIIKTYSQSYRIIMMMVIPMAIGLYFIADNFVLWFFGADFAKSSILIKISSLLIITMAIGNFVGVQYLIPTGRENSMTAIYIVAAIINICLNLVFIKKYMSIGALIASVIAETISAGAQMWLMHRGEYKISFLSGLWKYIMAGALMGVALFGLQQVSPITGAMQTIIEIIFGACVYGTILIVFREENIMMGLQTVKRRITNGK